MASKFDAELLFFCSENARLRLKDLAHILKKTPQRVKYNLAQLEKNTIIYSPHTIFDYSFLGQLLFKVYFKGGYTSEKNKKEILGNLCTNPYIVSVYELSGEFDLAVDMLSSNPSRFNKELKKVIAENPNLNSYKIALNVVTHLYPRYYLLLQKARLLDDLNSLNKIDSGIIVGGDRAVDFFTTGDMAVMSQLLQSPRIPLNSLAEKVQLNTKTVVKIMKNLRSRTIIRGYHYLIDTNALGIEKHRLFLKLHNLSVEKENELFEYFRKTAEIVQINKTVGDWDLEIDVEALEKNKIRYIIMQLRENFADLIENFRSMEFYQYYKKNFLPEYLFNKES